MWLPPTASAPTIEDFRDWHGLPLWVRPSEVPAGSSNPPEPTDLRVLISVTPFLPVFGGVQRVILEHSRRVATRGIHIDVLTTAVSDAPVMEHVGATEVFRLATSRRRAIGVVRAARFVGRHQSNYDVVHIHGASNEHAIAVGLACKRPLIVQPHFHGVPPRLRPVWAAHLRRLLHRAEAFVFVSEPERERFVELVGRPRRSVVIPNGAGIPASLSAAPDRPFVLVTSRLVRHKRVDRIIEAVLRGDVVDLVVVGDGPDLAHLRARYAPHAERIRFLGQVDDTTLSRLLGSATAYVTFSSQEAFGISLLEALSAGIPAVATDIPEHRYVRSLTPDTPLRLVAPEATTSELSDAIVWANAQERTRPTSTAVLWDGGAEALASLYREVATRC